jgi:hypothetical protein
MGVLTFQFVCISKMWRVLQVRAAFGRGENLGSDLLVQLRTSDEKNKRNAERIMTAIEKKKLLIPVPRNLCKTFNAFGNLRTQETGERAQLKILH